MRIKQVHVETFKALKNDTELLDLLEVDYKGLSPNEVMTNVRKQIIESSKPDGLLTDYSTRLAIHEEDGGFNGINTETSYLAIDIHITNDNNKKDRRALLIIQRLIELLDTKQRAKQGLPKLPIGLDGLVYTTKRVENVSTRTTTGWEKYTVVFKYKFLL